MNENKNTLCLIDGSGYIFRAFYALPPMNRPDGTPTNAVYGFTNMIMNLIQENTCSHRVVIFDAKRCNFRHTIYPEYKSNRRETPPDLIPQFSLIRQACEALNIPWIEQEGFEADDLIATYASIASHAGWKVTVISADKDLMQLMSDSVQLYDPMKKKMLSNQDVQSKFGVYPDKVIDVQSLMGDSTDNIPGATGIGPKTAAELIQQFGSLHNLLNRLEEVPQTKRREGLIRDKEQILISEKLVTLDNNVPVDQDLNRFQARPYDAQALTMFLTQNNFQSLLKKIVHIPHNSHPVFPTDNLEISIIQTKETLSKWLECVHDKICLFLQTTASDNLVGIALSNTEHKTCYIPLQKTIKHENIATDLFENITHTQQMDVLVFLDILKPFLENPLVLKIGHNIKKQWHILANYLKTDFRFNSFADIELMSYNANGTQHEHTLEVLAQKYLKVSFEPSNTEGKQPTPQTASENDMAQLYTKQAHIIGQLYFLLKQKMHSDETWKIYQDIDSPLIPILYYMENKGILVDKAELIALDQQFTRRLENLTQQIYQEAQEEFNINSPAQLGVILFEKRRLSGGKRGATGHWITDIATLENLSEQGDNLAKLIVAYRSISKLKSTYIDALIERMQNSSRIHTTFSLTATNTGRLASSNPNLQNIPIRTEEGKEIRHVFKARPGYKILSADYSQIELRLIAEVANVQKLKESFLNNEDIHARTASQILNIPLEEITQDQRRRAKAINFGIIYGISPFGLAANLGISRGEAKTYIDTYLQQYPEIQSYMETTKEFAKQNGYVYTPFGRKIYIAGLDNKATQNFALRAAINAPIQGGAADIIKMAMIHVQNALKKTNLDATLLLQVHDELIFEVKESDIPQTTQLVKEQMQQVVNFSIPLVVEVGCADNWKDAH